MKVIIDIPEIPTNDKQRWALANGTPYAHGEWIYHKEWELDGECAFECSKCGMGTDVDYNFCPNCGANMRVKDELNRVSKELNSEIEKSKSEIVPDYRDGWRLREGDMDG